MNARGQILGRIRSALGDGDGAAPAPRRYQRLDLPRPDVVSLFAERVADHPAVIRHVGADELATAMAAMLWAREAKRVAVPADLPRAWIAALDGVRTLVDAPPLDPAALAESDGVVTGCALAVAETGAVVLDGGRAQGRRELTLIPGHHLCVVHADQIVGTVAEAVDRLDPYRPLSWIAGPSGDRTFEIIVIDE
jgi:L-lactate dehydrogenase complex protein LldG